MTAHPDNQRPAHKHTRTKVRTRETHGIQQELWDQIVTTPSLFIIRLLRKGGSPSLLILRSTLIRTPGPHIWKHKILHPTASKYWSNCLFFLWWTFEQEYEIPRQLSKVLLIPAHLTMNIKFPKYFYLFPPYMFFIILIPWWITQICGHLNASAPTPEPWSDHHIHTLWRHYPCTLDTPIMRISSACLW